MPLKNGNSKKTISNNIRTLMRDWESSGSIGKSYPKTKKKAIDQSVAIAMSKAGKNKKGR